MKKATKSVSQAKPNLARARRLVRTTKSELLSFTTDARQLTSKLISRVDAAGFPPVRNGKQIQAALHSALTQVRTAFGTLHGRVAALPTNLSAFVKAADVFKTFDIGSTLDKAFAPLQKYPAPAIDRAATKV